MARTCLTFLFENLPPTLFLLNLRQLVMAGTSYHTSVRALLCFTDLSSAIRGSFILRAPQELLWNLFYHSYTDISPVKNHDFALNSVPWDFSVQLGPTGLSAAQFYHRVCQICPSRKDRERRHEDLMHLRTGKRLAFAKCAKNAKSLKSIEFKEPGAKEW